MKAIEIDEPVDYVFHLAAIPSPIDYLRLPLLTLKIGSYGTHNALGLAKFKRARSCSPRPARSMATPGAPAARDLLGQREPGRAARRVRRREALPEAMTMAYHRQQGVNTAIARIFNTYGPRMRPYDGRAIPTFVRQALENKPLTIFGDGSQTRSFCYVDDLISGLYALAASDEHYPVNLGNPSEFTILELAETVLKVTGSKSEIVFEALPMDDPQIRQPDITRAKEILGWTPRSISRKACGACCLPSEGSLFVLKRLAFWRPRSSARSLASPYPRRVHPGTCSSASTTSHRRSEGRTGPSRSTRPCGSRCCGPTSTGATFRRSRNRGR